MDSMGVGGWNIAHGYGWYLGGGEVVERTMAGRRVRRKGKIAPAYSEYVRECVEYDTWNLALAPEYLSVHGGAWAFKQRA